jgi:hypothetical protein
MQLKWDIYDEDANKVRILIQKHQEHPMLVERRRRNVEGIGRKHLRVRSILLDFFLNHAGRVLASNQI